MQVAMAPGRGGVAGGVAGHLGSTARILASPQSPGSQLWDNSSNHQSVHKSVRQGSCFSFLVQVVGLHRQCSLRWPLPLCLDCPVPRPFPRTRCACANGPQLVKHKGKNQVVRFPRGPSGRIDPLSASSRFQVSLFGAMGDQPWGPRMQVPD